MIYITIDGKEFELSSLTEHTKFQMTFIQYMDAEIARLQAKAVVLETARLAYSKALNA